MKGKNYLLVSGILLVLQGIVGIMLYGLMILITGIGAGMGAAGNADAGIMVVLIASAGLAIVISVFDLVVGIIGIRGRNKQEKANLCMKLGIAVLVINILYFVFSIIGGAMNATAVLSVVFGLVVSALYIYGAKLNKEV